jgi:glutamine synthetase
LLKEFLAEFEANINAKPYFGIELEFYLLNQDSSALKNSDIIKDYLLKLSKILENFSLFKELQLEQGSGQIEIKTHKTNQLLDLGYQLEEMKIAARACANSQNLIASFASQPFIDDCGSALQLNLSLYCESSHDNLFLRNPNQKNQILLHSIAGIFELLDSMMIFYAPKAEDYLRFDKKINLNLYQKGKYSAPINKSWGINNRTTAIRIPEIPPTQKQQQSRLEYRIPAADADIYLNMLCLLTATEYGIKNQSDCTRFNLNEDGLYGNAFDPQYDLQNLVNNQEAARKHFVNSNLFPNQYFQTNKS